MRESSDRPSTRYRIEFICPLRGRAGAHQSCVIRGSERNIVKLCCQANAAGPRARLRVLRSRIATLRLPMHGSVAGRRLRKRVDLGLGPVGAPALHEVMPMHHVVVRWIAWRWAIGPGQERPSPAARPSPTPAHGRGAVPVVVPSPAHITEPVLRHTALGQCARDGLHATVCRHRFPSVRSIRLASWSTGPRWA
jgi:hypothetical protein